MPNPICHTVREFNNNNNNSSNCHNTSRNCTEIIHIFNSVPTKKPNDIWWDSCMKSNAKLLVHASEIQNDFEEKINTIVSWIKRFTKCTNRFSFRIVAPPAVVFHISAEIIWPFCWRFRIRRKRKLNTIFYFVFGFWTSTINKKNTRRFCVPNIFSLWTIRQNACTGSNEKKFTLFSFCIVVVAVFSRLIFHWLHFNNIVKCTSRVSLFFFSICWALRTSTSRTNTHLAKKKTRSNSTTAAARTQRM